MTPLSGQNTPGPRTSLASLPILLMHSTVVERQRRYASAMGLAGEPNNFRVFRAADAAIAAAFSPSYGGNGVAD